MLTLVEGEKGQAAKKSFELTANWIQTSYRSRKEVVVEGANFQKCYVVGISVV